MATTMDIAPSKVHTIPIPRTSRRRTPPSATSSPTSAASRSSVRHSDASERDRRVRTGRTLCSCSARNKAQIDDVADLLPAQKAHCVKGSSSPMPTSISRPRSRLLARLTNLAWTVRRSYPAAFCQQVRVTDRCSRHRTDQPCRVRAVKKGLRGYLQARSKFLRPATLDALSNWCAS